MADALKVPQPQPQQQQDSQEPSEPQTNRPAAKQNQIIDQSLNVKMGFKNFAMLYKSKPTQSVKTRVKNSLQHRRCSRLLLFDKRRDLTIFKSPFQEPKLDAHAQLESLKQQLFEWKAKKIKERVTAAWQKKKPFIVGIPHGSLRHYIPPPTVPVGRRSPSPASRSQAARIACKISQPTTSNNHLEPSVPNCEMSQPPTSPNHSEPSVPNTTSFAPLNAKFKPPVLKNDYKLYVSFSQDNDDTTEEMNKVDEGGQDVTSNISNGWNFRQNGRRKLVFEIRQLTELCETLNQVLEKTVEPDSIQNSSVSNVDNSDKENNKKKTPKLTRQKAFDSSGS